MFLQNNLSYGALCKFKGFKAVPSKLCKDWLEILCGMHRVLSNPHILSPAGSVDMQWDYQGNQEEATGPGFSVGRCWILLWRTAKYKGREAREKSELIFKQVKA